MSKLRHIARAAMAGAITLLATAAWSAAQDNERPLTLTPKAHADAPRVTVKKPAKASAITHTKAQSALALAADAPAQKKEHRLILQVNANDPAAMNLALNNAANVTQYYKEVGEAVKIEVVTFGPGLHMLRDDTSPVKARIVAMAQKTPEVSFKACGNTQANMSKAENKSIPIIPQAEVVASGLVHIMQLEEQGWTYVKP